MKGQQEQRRRTSSSPDPFPVCDAEVESAKIALSSVMSAQAAELILRDAYLRRPPFRFIHDVVFDVFRNCGVGLELFHGEECDSRSIRSKQMKMAWLSKLLSFLAQYDTGGAYTLSSVRPAKVVAGKQCGLTLKLFAALVHAAKAHFEAANRHMPPSIALDLCDVVRSPPRRKSQKRHSLDLSQYFVKKLRLSLPASLFGDGTDTGEALLRTHARMIATALGDFGARAVMQTCDGMRISLDENEFHIHELIFDSFIRQNALSSATKDAADTETFAHDLPLQYLERLYVKGDAIVEKLPGRLFCADTIPKLSILSLKHLSLKNIPESLGTLVHLTSLDLGHNELTEPPASLEGLAKLRILRLDHNKIRFPPELRCAHMSKLETLDLSFNRLTCPPAELSMIGDSLKVVYLHSNMLTEIPHFLTLPCMKALDRVSLWDNAMSERECAIVDRAGGDDAASMIACMKKSRKLTRNVPLSGDDDEQLDASVEIEPIKIPSLKEAFASSISPKRQSASPKQTGDIDLVGDLLQSVRATGKLNLCNFKTVIPDLYRLRLFVEEASVAVEQLSVRLKWTEDNARRELALSPVLQLLMSMPKLAIIWVHFEGALEVKATAEESVLDCSATGLSTTWYLGADPYDAQFDPPILLKEAHRALAIGFHVVNCTLAQNRMCCKFLVMAR